MTDNSDKPKVKLVDLNHPVPPDLRSNFNEIADQIGGRGKVFERLIRAFVADPSIIDPKPQMAFSEFKPVPEYERLKAEGILDVIPNLHMADFSSEISNAKRVFICSDDLNFFIKVHTHFEAFLSRFPDQNKTTVILADGGIPPSDPLISLATEAAARWNLDEWNILSGRILIAKKPPIRKLPRFALIYDNTAVTSHATETYGIKWRIREVNSTNFGFSVYGHMAGELRQPTDPIFVFPPPNNNPVPVRPSENDPV